ncbi:Protein SRT-52 [Aphelenchoides avenae]|nr:Protein SRT-52 [Aphelenchus avenae]
MEIYLVRHDLYDRLYNCSFYDVNSISIEQRQHKGFGALFIALSLVFEVLYVPCAISIWKHRENSCYKIMLYIAVNDMCCLWICGFLNGYFAFTGAVFCSYPSIIYLAGNIGFTIWISESTAELVLALNRCVAMSSPKWERILFKGSRTWVWLLVPTLYAMYSCWFTIPIVFSGIYMSWFLNPHVGYFDDPQQTYVSALQVGHNYLIIIGFVVTYSAFGILLLLKSAKISAAQEHFSNRASNSYARKMTFVQVAVISVVHVIGAGIYTYQQFFRVTQEVIYLGQFAWLMIHGIPPVIYLIMNKTIRTDTTRMLGRLMPAQHQAQSTDRQLGTST